jgi:hypothetical protein
LLKVEEAFDDTDVAPRVVPSGQHIGKALTAAAALMIASC